MRKLSLSAEQKGRERNNRKFVSQAAKALLIVSLFLAVFLCAKTVFAQPALNFGLEYAQQTGLGTQDIRVTIARIIRILIGLLGITAVVIILYGGYSYMTSQGNPEKVEKAKKILINGTIGLIIILLSFAIVQFILNYLAGAAGRGGGGRPTYGAAGGALGNGILQSHYPERNAIGIPRNTSIVVTFKEPIKVNSIISDTNGDEGWGDCDDSDGSDTLDYKDVNGNGKLDAGDSAECDLINRDSIQIRKTSDNAISGPFVEFVKASVTADSKTFVFKPYELLGSSSENTSYTVTLTGNILKANGASAFGSFGSYSWKFEVSTQVDTTPPQVKSVLPKFSNNPNQSVARNHIVQINFNEPINPMTIRGTANITGADEKIGPLASGSYQIINVCKETIPGDCKSTSQNIIAGEFLYSNGYQTVEFLTNDLYGQNTCGDDVYLLPADSFITVLIKAATLNSTGLVNFPYDGIVDMADNSLDGNKDGLAKGPVDPPYYLNQPPAAANISGFGDSAMWSFYTNASIEIAPPEISSTYPAAAAKAVDPSQTFQTVFDRLLMSSTLKSGYEGFCPCNSNNDCGTDTCGPNNYCVDSSAKKYICSTPCATGQACVAEKKFIVFNQPTEAEITAACPTCDIAGWPYWLRNTSDEIRTTALIKHDTLGGNLKFGVDIGSGVKDVYQNCYLPCAGPSCEKKEIKPGEYQQGSIWTGLYPSCDLTTP
jgi:phage shock protein PspC (stress-responsive transcriptional regulator)